MNRRVVRSVYRLLLGMHPAAFCVRFGPEMLQVFDDAVETFGWAWLLADLAMSLGRQRVLRSNHANDLAASAAGLMSGVYTDTRPPHLTCAKLGSACVLSLLSVFLFNSTTRADPPRQPIHHHRAATVASCCREVGHESIQRQ